MTETLAIVKTKPVTKPEAPPIEVPTPKVKGPVQELLEEALAELGPNGENWTKGALVRGKNVCSVGAVARAMAKKKKRKKA